MKVAVTEEFAESVTVHAAAPLQAPDHPPNVLPGLGVAVSVIDVPVSKLALHVEPQLMPEGLLVTAPAPVPEFCTVKVMELELPELPPELPEPLFAVGCVFVIPHPHRIAAGIAARIAYATLHRSISLQKTDWMQEESWKVGWRGGFLQATEAGTHGELNAVEREMKFVAAPATVLRSVLRRARRYGLLLFCLKLEVDGT